MKWVHNESPWAILSLIMAIYTRQNGRYVKLFTATNYLFGLLYEAKGSCRSEFMVMDNHWWSLMRHVWESFCIKSLTCQLLLYINILKVLSSFKLSSLLLFNLQFFCFCLYCFWFYFVFIILFSFVFCFLCF